MRKTYIILILIFVLLLSSYLIIDKTKSTEKDDDYETKIKASSIMESCLNLIKSERLKKDLYIDNTYDINKTGIIGYELTPTTTTLGNLESKRTSTNPNMAAVVVDMFSSLGLKDGNTIAVNFSSSFPAMNIAVLSAMEAIGLKGIIISSVGSSTYGGNIPGFTYMDMEQLLFNNNLISNRSCAFSLGGIDDIGKEMEPNAAKEIVERIENYDVDFIHIEDIEENINLRYNKYYNKQNAKCFVNVGGNIVSFGKGSMISYVGGGIITSLPRKADKIGLVQLFIKDDTPIVHLLNIKDIAIKHGLPIDPVPIPYVGSGSVYYKYKYKKNLAILFLILSFILLIKYKRELK